MGVGAGKRAGKCLTEEEKEGESSEKKKGWYFGMERDCYEFCIFAFLGKRKRWREVQFRISLFLVLYKYYGGSPVCCR